MKELTLYAPAKVNLHLHITGKRADGYHELQSVMAFTDLADRIDLLLRNDGGISLTLAGEKAALLENEAIEQNLAYKAARALYKHLKAQLPYFTYGVDITLTKHIPIGAGLGGGSSDAATILKGLCVLWQYPIDMALLSTMGLTLGADVPVCLHQKTAMVTGIGEQITPMTLSDAPYPIVLVNPNIPLNTVSVFKQRTGQYRAISTIESAVDLTMLQSLHNDLTEPASNIVPQITPILEALYQCEGITLARMSGSGATCFGLFTDEPHAIKAGKQLQKKFADYFVHVGWCG